jgi:non-specific serine/threonine protein kinase
MNVLDLLARLVDKSLVLADEQDGVVRYRLLEMALVRRRPNNAEAANDIRARARYHSSWSSRRAAVSGRPARWHAHPDTEHDNLRAHWRGRCSRATPNGAALVARCAGTLGTLSALGRGLYLAGPRCSLGAQARTPPERKS